MSSKRSLWIALVLAVGVASVLLWRSRSRSSESFFDTLRAQLPSRDVVLITCDTTRWDHIGCYFGDVTRSEAGQKSSTARRGDVGVTSAIDAIAHSGLRFRQAYAATPITLPSHSSLFTGLNPPAHGVRNNGTYALPKECVTVAEVLKEEGWRTAAFVSAFVLDQRFGLAQGFEHYDDALDKTGPSNGGTAAPGALKETDFVVQSRRSDATVARALDWVSRVTEIAPKGERLFLWLHFFDPHAPYNPQQALYGDSIEARYDAEIFEMDRALGNFRTQFEKQRGQAPLYIVTTDHGEGLSQPHGEVIEPAHGIFLYNDTLRIPWIMSIPGVTEASVSDRVARQIDLLPTLYDLLGKQAPTQLSGISLAAPSATIPCYLESELGYEDYGWAPQAALLQNGWKYIESPRPELYHLEEDPLEQHNLLSREPARVESMRAALARLRAGTGDRAAERLALDAQARATLASLSYSGGSRLYRREQAQRDPKELMTRSFNVQLELDKARMLLPLRPQSAVACLREILARDKSNAAALSLLGWESLRLADAPRWQSVKPTLLAAADDAFAAMRRYSPQRPEGFYGEALTQAARGDAATARRQLELLLSKHPHYLPALEWMMRLTARAKEFERFFEVTAQILAVDPRHFEALFQRASAHQIRQQRPEAEALFLELLQSHGEHPQVRLGLAQIRLEENDPQAALDHLQRISDPRVRRSQRVDALEALCRRRGAR